MDHSLWRRRLTSGGGFAGVDMADDDDVDMSLFLTVEEPKSAMFSITPAIISRRRWRLMWFSSPHVDGFVKLVWFEVL